MYRWHSETCAIIQVKLECRPANPAYSFVAGYAGRYLQKTTNSAPKCSAMKNWQELNQKDDK